MYASVVFLKNQKVFKILSYSYDEYDCLHKMKLRAPKEPYEFLIMNLSTAEQGIAELKLWLEGLMFSPDKVLGIMSGISDAIKSHLSDGNKGGFIVSS